MRLITKTPQTDNNMLGAGDKTDNGTNHVNMQTLRRHHSKVTCHTTISDETTHMTRVGQDHIYTVYIRYLWLEDHQIYGHIRCIYTVFLAGKSPNTQSYTVHIYGIFGREITKYTVIYGAYIRFWPTLNNSHVLAGCIACCPQLFS